MDMQSSKKRMHAEEAVIVLTRAPGLGQGKTRLMEPLSPDERAELQLAMLLDTCDTIRSSDRDMRICCTPGEGAQELRKLLGDEFTYHAQRGTCLKDRMRAAMADAFSQGYERCAMVGSDCPVMAVADIDAAFKTLRSRDVAIGPAADGGFYLIGLKRYRSAAFSCSEYGHDQVLEQTVASLERAGLSIGFTDIRRDIDQLDDLLALASAPRDSCPRTVRFARQLAGTVEGAAVVDSEKAACNFSGTAIYPPRNA